MKTKINLDWTSNLYEVGAPIRDGAKDIWTASDLFGFPDQVGIEALRASVEKDSGPSMLNALAWYAGEEVARAYCDAFDPQ